MKKFNISHIIFGLAALLLSATACVEPSSYLTPGEKDDLYPISFRVRTEDDVLTKAGPISGTDAVINKLFMYCFDANGRFLGRFAADRLTSEPLEYTENQTPGEFEGKIPPATARIHFVGNADCPAGGDMIGMTEEQVMHSPGLVYVTKTSPMSYWGYLRRDSAGEMASLFDGSAFTTVWMVRDRLKIVAGSYDSSVFYDDISWVVYNGLNNGYVASYGTRPADTFHDDAWFDENNPYQELRHTPGAGSNFSLSSYVTAYPESGGRFETTESDMVPFDKSKTGYEPMFVFDDECPYYNTQHVTKIIVKATFKVTGNSAEDHANHTRYFPICITHGFNAEPIPIHRGHLYQLSLQVLPEASGYEDFEGAAASKTFANGALVDIPDDVIEVSDGSFNMRVNYTMTYPLSGESFFSTAVLLQSTTPQVTVPFTVSKLTGPDRDFDFSESDWIPKDEEDTTPPAHTTGDATWGAGISSDKHATIGGNLNTTVTLPVEPVSSTLKKSVFNLKGFYMTKQTVEGVEFDVKHILMRNIDVYEIDRFLIQEVYTSSSENHNAAGNLVLVSLGNNKYRLKFRLPGGTEATGDHDAYPELLYPLQVKFATRTLQPTNIYINGVEQQNAVFGVQVRSTVPNTQPAMLPAQTNANQWNYQSTNNYWNFWYTYPIVSVPRYTGAAGEIQTGESGQEVVGPEVWVDFVDVRNPSVFQTIPNNVGLYLYIEFFGAANAVSINAAYVHVTGITVHRQGQTQNGTSNNNRYQLRRNSTLQLEATVSPNNASYKNVQWTSSNTNRATVDANGLVTSYNTGNNNNVQITATTVDGSYTDTFYLTIVNN